MFYVDIPIVCNHVGNCEQYADDLIEALRLYCVSGIHQCNILIIFAKNICNNTNTNYDISYSVSSTFCYYNLSSNVVYKLSKH